jgi:hypothetical protein
MFWIIRFCKFAPPLPKCKTTSISIYLINFPLGEILSIVRHVCYRLPDYYILKDEKTRI